MSLPVLNAPNYGPAVDLAAATVAANDNFISTSGYHEAGDRGVAVYRRKLALEAAKPGDLLSNGDTVRWEVHGSEVSDAMFGAKGDGVTDDTAATQAALDYLRILGGGKLWITKGVHKLTATYRGTDGIYPGYVAGDENRRAHKALIVYDSPNITIEFEAGAVWDRSQDMVSDPAYSGYAATLYVSKSPNFMLVRPNSIGVQNDAALLIDDKTLTSGDHVQINNGSHNWRVIDPDFQDGTTGISVGMNRSIAYQSIDPNLMPCIIGHIQGRLKVKNCEHGFILFACERVVIDVADLGRWKRPNGTTGVCQRGAYFHSCTDVTIRELYIDGCWKTSVMFARYAKIDTIKIERLVIPRMMSDDEVRTARGSGLNKDYEGQAISVQSDNISDISIDEVFIDRVMSSIHFPEVGMKRFRIGKGRACSAMFGVVTNPLLPAGRNVVNNPIAGLDLEGLEIVVQETSGYSQVSVNSGLMLKSGAVDGYQNPVNGRDLSIHNTKVYSRNRNALVVGFQGIVTNNNFTQLVDYPGAKNFDFNYSGPLIVSNNRYGNYGAPNGPQSVP